MPIATTSAMPIFTALLLALVTGASLATSESSEPADTTDDAPPAAVLLTDFTDPDLNDRWAVVNDNVMGGRSDGSMAHDVEAGTMTLTGNINTNGGGFTSVRMRLDPSAVEDPDIFTDLRAVRLRVRANAASIGKPFALRLEDRVPRRLGINFRAVLPLDPDQPADQWQTVTVPLANLQPTHHGRTLDPQQWTPLDPNQLHRLGIILNNVDDGPYRLDIDRIELLR